ncbi:MAG: hypothetical protein AAGC60_23285 [Acidobacteriota bacterium]
MDRPSSRRPWQRPIAVVLALLWSISGVVPVLHHHETADVHCHDSDPGASTHLEALEAAHHDACGLCAKAPSSASLDRDRTQRVPEPVAEQAQLDPRALPLGLAGRHGAARAPPLG